MSNPTEILDEIQDRADLEWDEHMYDMNCPEEVLDDIRRLVAALRAVLAVADEHDTEAEAEAGVRSFAVAYRAGAHRRAAQRIREAITEALMVEM